MNELYKLEHEAFVSNLTGSNIFDLLCCLLFSPLLILLTSLLSKTFPSISIHLIELSCFLFPQLLVLTYFAHQIYSSFVFLLFVIFILVNYLVSLPIDSLDYSNKSNNTLNLSSNKASKKTFVTIFKGSLVLLTCIAILAIDFPIFPRRFGKTEQYGLSLMDIGVGGFVLSTTMTSKYARGVDNNNNPVNPWKTFFSFQRIIVLCLGFGRLILLKAINYHEHVSEYGIHWNFFMTLFVIWSLLDLLHLCVSSRFLHVFIGLIILLLYQYSLSSSSLFTDYLFSNQRITFLDANKEGIFSLAGYFPLAVITEYLSYVLIFQPSSPSSSSSSISSFLSPSTTSVSSPSIASSNKDISKKQATKERLWSQSIAFVLSTFALWVIYWMLQLIQPSSRRICNPTYVFLTLSISFTILTCFYLIEHFDSLFGLSYCFINMQFPFLEACNEYSLYVFLIANVLTGIINMSCETIYQSWLVSFVILLIYLLLLVLFTLVFPILVKYISNK